MSVLKRCLSYIESQIKGVIKAGTQPGFSLIFKVDSYDIKEGGLVTECCRQFQAFTLSLYPRFPLKVNGSNLHVAGFLAGCRHLMKTLGTSYRCSFYQGVCLIEMAIKRVDCHVMWVKSKGVKISIFTSAFAWHYLKWNFETSSWTLFFHSCSKWKVCARAKANRTDILQSKCSMIKQYGWISSSTGLVAIQFKARPRPPVRNFVSKKSWVQILNHRPMSSALISSHLKAFLQKITIKSESYIPCHQCLWYSSHKTHHS